MREVHPHPNNFSSGSPVKSSHVLLKKSREPSGRAAWSRAGDESIICRRLRLESSSEMGSFFAIVQMVHRWKPGSSFALQEPKTASPNTQSKVRTPVDGKFFVFDE